MRTKSKELASDYRVLERTVPARDVGRDVERRQLSVTALRWELEPIARGTEGGYSREERKAAFSILNGLERLERDAPNRRLTVAKDVHQTLHELGEVKAQIAQARERAADRNLAQTRDRGRGLGR